MFDKISPNSPYCVSCTIHNYNNHFQHQQAEYIPLDTSHANLPICPCTHPVPIYPPLYPCTTHIPNNIDRPYNNLDAPFYRSSKALKTPKIWLFYKLSRCGLGWEINDYQIDKVFFVLVAEVIPSPTTTHHHHIFGNVFTFIEQEYFVIGEIVTSYHY